MDARTSPPRTFAAPATLLGTSCESGTIADGTQVRVRARFAGLEGYLWSKYVAVHTRATKDYYDLVYVLLHNRAGGPEPAAQRLLDGGLADALGALRTTFRENGLSI